MENFIKLTKGYLLSDGKFPPLINSFNYLTHYYKCDVGGISGSLYKIGQVLPICVKVDSKFLADREKVVVKEPVKPQPTPKPQPTIPVQKIKGVIDLALLHGDEIDYLLDYDCFYGKGKKNILAFCQNNNFIVASEYGAVTISFKEDCKKSLKGSDYIGVSVRTNYCFSVSDFNNPNGVFHHDSFYYDDYRDFFVKMRNLFSAVGMDSITNRKFHKHCVNLENVICQFVSHFITGISN